MPNGLAKNKITHISLVLDASSSMEHLRESLIKVVDGLVSDWASESRRLAQEARVTVYSFNEKVSCLIWDMDVLRLPSLVDLYRPNGATALLGAVEKSLEDMAHTWEEYGEHSFLSITITDGEENATGGKFHRGEARILNPIIDRISSRISHLPDHWTAAILVPNVLAKRKAVSYGFPAGNVAVWNADSEKGAEEVIGVVGAATKSFMRSRTQGVRGTKNLFAIGQDVSVDEVKANLEPVSANKYRLLKVDKEVETRAFVESQPGLEYKRGRLFYQLGGRVQVQRDKEIVAVEKDTDRAYSGEAARQFLFGSDINGTVSVKAGHNPKLEIYVQSKSPTRKLKAGTRCLFMV